MKPINVELTMGHALRLSESYYKPTEKEVLADYLKAVDLLTINDVKSTLQKQVVEFTEKSKEETHIIKGKLAEKENKLKAVKDKLDSMDRKYGKILNRMESIDKFLAENADIIADTEPKSCAEAIDNIITNRKNNG
jgi:hypothetical protein